MNLSSVCYASPVSQSAELELCSGRQHLEHLTASAIELCPLGVCSVAQLAATLGVGQ
jgi:hypothetical protein